MRVYIMYLGTAFLAMYAWRDWFPAAAGLVLMMAVNYHPDMPREMFGVPGLNPWNFLLLATIPAWLAARRREGLRWDLPASAAVLLAAYVGLICVGFVRLFLDRGPVYIEMSDLVGEYIINPLKYLVPALMIFDGARNKKRWLFSVAGILGVYVFLSLLVLKWMPLRDARPASSARGCRSCSRAALGRSCRSARSSARPSFAWVSWDSPASWRSRWR
jgi:hypothetical protein